VAIAEITAGILVGGILGMALLLLWIGTAVNAFKNRRFIWGVLHIFAIVSLVYFLYFGFTKGFKKSIF